MNNSGGGWRPENAQKATAPLSNYQFDFGLGSSFSSTQPIKSLKDQKHNSPSQVPSSAQSQKPAWTPNKPSWSPQPSFSSPANSRATQSSGWSSQSGISSGQPQKAGDIFGKSWSKPPDSSTGITGGLNSGAAPHLFGDLLGAALGQQKSNPIKQSKSSSAASSYSMGSMSAALPKGGISMKDQQKITSVRSAEDFGVFGGSNSGGKGPDPFEELPTFSNKVFKGAQKSNSSVSSDPFGEFGNVSATNSGGNMNPSAHKDDAFGDFQKGSANQPSSAGGGPFPKVSNTRKSDFSFGASSNRNGGKMFTDPLASLSESFSSQKQASTESISKDPLGSLFSPSSTTASNSIGGVGGQTVLESDDWGLDSEFGGAADMGPTTELEGLPPPPAGVNISIAKDKGMENYKQGQFADALKWLSWAIVLLEKRGNGGNDSSEVLTCRASCYKEVGEYKKAVADCSKVLEYDKSNVAVLLQRALLYESTEKYKLGVEDLRNVLKLDPANRLAKITLSRLAKLAD